MSDVYLQQFDLKQVREAARASAYGVAKENAAEDLHIKIQRPPEITNEEFMSLHYHVENGDMTSRQMSRLMSCMAISKQLDLPLEEIASNPAYFLKQFNIDANTVPEEKWYTAVWKAKNRGRISTMITQNWAKIREAERRGDKAAVDSYMKEIEAFEKEQEQYIDYSADERFFITKGLVAAAESSDYMAYISGMTVLGTMIAPGLGTIAGFLSGWHYNRDSEYGTLRKVGVKPEIADLTSTWVGAVQSAIESLVGRGVGKIMDVVGKKNAARFITDKIVDGILHKIHITGLPYIIGKYALGNLMEAIGEGNEEVLQSLTSRAGLFSARGIQMKDLEKALANPESPESKALLAMAQDVLLEDSIRQMAETGTLEAKAQLLDLGVQIDDWDSFSKELWKEFEGGFLSALVLQVGDAALKGSYKFLIGESPFQEAKKLRAIAEAIPVKEIYMAATEESEIPKAVRENTWEAASRAGAHEETHMTADLGETAGLGEGYEEAKTDPNTGEKIPLGEIYRRKNRLLYTELDEKRGLFKIGDPRVAGSKNLYSHIEYAQDEDGTVHIKEFRVRNDLDTPDFRHEAYDRFAESFSGVPNILWDKEGMSNREVKIREELKKKNPYDTGLNYYPEKINIADEIVDTAAKGDTAEAARAKMRFGEQMARHLPGSTEASRSGIVRFIDRIGRAYGLTFDKFLEKLNLDPDNIFTHKAGEAVEAENKMAAQFAKDEKKASRVKGALQPWIKLDADMKAVEYSIVYLDPEKADFSTVVHELKHAVDNFLEKCDPELFKRMMDAAGEYDPNSGMDEYTWRKERSAYAFENYFATGEAPNPELRSLFQQMKEWLKGIIDHFKEMRRLAPEQIKVFDELLSKADKVSEAASQKTAGTARNARESGKTANNAEVGARDAQKAAKERYEANKRFNEERPSLDKNNSIREGKPKQPSKNIDEIYKLIEESREEFDKYVDELQKKYGGEIIGGELKGKDRAERKITPLSGAENILDINRKTLVLDNIQDIVAVMEDLHGRDEVVRIKDRYKPIQPNHYKDVLINIKMSNGAIVELQLNTPQMLYAKEEMGSHLLYEIKDQIVKGYANKILSFEDYKKIERQCIDLEIRIHDAAYEASLNSANFNASSFDIVDASLKISAMVGQVQEGSNVLSPKTLKAIQDWREYAMGTSSTSQNSSEGSSKSGTSTSGKSETTVSSFDMSVPSTDNIEHKTNSVNTNFEKNPQKNNTANNAVDTSGLSDWGEQYAAAKKIYGDTDTVNIKGKEIKGQYVMLEAEIPMASHDEVTFNPTPGFPTIDGKNLNTRDYFHDRASQEAVNEAGSNFDSRALDDIPMVTKKRVVIDGSQRTMSSKIAAKKGTDGKYLNSLPQKSKKYGFKSEDRLQFNHPRIYFEVEEDVQYDAALFDQFNQSNKKATDPVETAVKMTKLIKDPTVKSIAAAIAAHESIDELYKDKKALQENFNTLKTDKLIGEYDMPQYYTEQGGITGAGEDLLENVLLGATLKEDNIRVLSDVKNLRRKLAMALPYLIENKAMGEYSVIPEVNEAVRIAAEVEKNSKIYKNVEEWAEQSNFDFMEQKNQIAVELAKQLEGKNQAGFADMMGGLNAVLSDAASGQMDLLSSNIESKENIVRRYLGIKAGIESIRQANNKIIEDERAPMVERNAAAMDNAGLAKTETVGSTLFQLAFQGSPYWFDKHDNSYVGGGFGNLHHGWGHYLYGKKEAAEWFRESISKVKGVEGQLYEVDIPGDDKLLHWEKPISEQSEIVRQAADRLITWNKKGESEFNKAYNIKKFNDGSYGFIRSIDGKAKWATREEAQAAAKEAIKKTLTGKEFYNALSKKIGARETSLLLDHLGVRGTKYFDRNTEKIGVPMAHNYVIYGDGDINITQTFFQTAYHGSPYRFDRFDSSHMGEGEGAQSYGWGHYFAGKKEVAEYYRKKLTERNDIYYVDGEKVYVDKRHKLLYEMAMDGTLEKYIKSLEEDLITYKRINSDFNIVMTEQSLKKAKELIGKKVETKSGQLYEVDIPGDEEMLDWDKKLTEQPEYIQKTAKEFLTWETSPDRKTSKLWIHDCYTIQYFDDGYGLKNEGRGTRNQDIGKERWKSLSEAQDAINEQILNNYSGALFYSLLEGKFESEGINERESARATSKYLNSLGIKGIRYLDGNSRADGEGSHNYVIFDDNEINITQTFFQIKEDLTVTDESLTQEQAVEILKSLEHKDLINNETGISAQVNSEQRGKLVSNEAVKKSVENGYTREQHIAAAVKIDKIWKHAIKIEDRADLKNDKNIKSIKRFVAPLRYGDETAYANLLVKESEERSGERRHRIYTVELQEINKLRSIMGTLDNERIRLRSPLLNKIMRLAEIVNPSGTEGWTFLQAAEDEVLYQLDDELVEDAAQYDSWEEFRNSVQKTEASDADNAWYKSLWEDSRKIHDTTLFQDEEETSRAQELDNSFYNMANKKYLTAVLKELYRIHDDQSLKPMNEENEAQKEFKHIKRLQRRINTELPNAGSVIGMAAQVRGDKKQLSPAQYNRLKSFMRKNMRDFRSVFADIMEQEEYLEDLAEMKDGEPAGRLANPHPERQNTKARLKEIASIIKKTDPELARGIEDGTVSYDDPRVKAFEAGVDTEYKEAKAAIEALEKETAEDYARLANDAQRRIVNAHEKMIKAQEQMEVANDAVLRRKEKEGEIAKPYLNRQRLEKAGYEQALKAYNDLVNLYGLNEEVRTIIDRQKVIANERGRFRDIMLRQRAAKALRETKKKLVKRITRKVSFDNVSYDHAELAKTIQRIFFNISDGINKWVGPEDRKVLREVWSQWSTDEEFRNKLLDPIKKRNTKSGFKQAAQIENILNKEWENITVNEKKTLHRILPKTNIIQELGLRKLAKENWESAQLDIDEHVEENGEAFLIIGEDLKRRVIDVTGEELYNRMQNKPFAEWSLSEAEELGRVIDKLVVEGKRKEAARKEAKRVLEERYRGEVLDALEKLDKKYVINPDDTPEEKERKRNKQNKILKKFAKGKKNNLWNNFFDANLRRFTTALDGGRKGIFTNLLYWGENDAYNMEQRQIAARQLVIDKVMKDNGISLDELYREVEIPSLKNALNASDVADVDLFRVSDGKVTVDDLLYIMRGNDNEETRKAIMYGNLSNARERDRANINIEAQEEFANVTRVRMASIMNFARIFFNREENRKFMKLYEAIGTDYDNNGERLNRACIDMFNKPMWRVENYVPMNRREQTGAENENRVIEDLLGMTGAGSKWVEKGFTVKREKISPGGQRPIELGLYKTWAKSVNATEHLLAYGPLVQTLNAVFKGYHAGEVKQALHDRWGQAAVSRVDDTIAEFANPKAARETANRQNLNRLVRALRGKTATAYLAWKTSGVLKQLATSPWPYLQEIPPAQYLAACVEVAGGAGKINDFIREKSVYMKNRDFDLMAKIIREARESNDNAIQSKIDKFNSVGMKGLEWVDWICVAPGWLAKYRSELANIAKEQEAKYQEALQKYEGKEYADVLPTRESKVNRALSDIMSDERQDAEAVARADDAVRRMQPSSRSTDIAPLYKNQDEVLNILLQFQTALNVIWQNVRYDLPLAVKEKQVGTIVGMVTGYALAGICMGLLTDGLGDDDDDEGKKARKILFYSFTQFSDAVPIIGDGVTLLAERFLTGKRSYTGQQSVLPAVEKALGGLGNAAGALWDDNPEKRRKHLIKAVENMAEAAGLGFGLPVSGAKELGRAVGVGDGDGEFNLYLQALMGRKNK